jgi:hypothetical protein
MDSRSSSSRGATAIELEIYKELLLAATKVNTWFVPWSMFAISRLLRLRWPELKGRDKCEVHHMTLGDWSVGCLRS